MDYNKNNLQSIKDQINAILSYNMIIPNDDYVKVFNYYNDGNKNSLKENKENGYKIIENLSTCFKDFLVLVTYFLMNKDPFIGNILIQFNKIISYKNFNQSIDMDINSKINQINMIINPILFIKESDLDLDKSMLLIEHECLHLISNHYFRKFKLSGLNDEDTISDIAIDYFANKDLLKIIKENNSNSMANAFLDLEKSGRFINRKTIINNFKIDPELYNTVESLYEKLNKSQKSNGGNNGSSSKSDNQSNNNDNKSDNSQSNNNDNNSNNGQSNNNDNKSDNSQSNSLKEFLDNFKPNCNHSHKTVNSESENELNKNFINNMLDNTMKRIGSEKVNPIYRKLFDLSFEKPVENWKSILSKMVGSIPAPYKKTYLRRNRIQPNRYDLKGKINKKVSKILIAIDESGSISSSEINKYINEIFGILRNTTDNTVTLIEWGTEVSVETKIKDLNDFKKSYIPKCTGGTDFINSVVKYISKLKPHDVPDITIVFTDGYFYLKDSDCIHTLNVQNTKFMYLIVGTSREKYKSSRIKDMFDTINKNPIYKNLRGKVSVLEKN